MLQHPTFLRRAAPTRIVALLVASLVAGLATGGATAAPTPNPAPMPAPATAPATAVEPIDQVRAALARRFPSLRIEGLHAAPVAGLWEFSVGLDVFYASSDGRYIVRGDVIDLAGSRNYTDERRAELRRGELAKVAESDMIVFAPERPLYTVTVFTDIDCAYCRKLHAQIGEYLKRGIRVRYVAFPRAGLGSESWQKAQAVWCAKDRNGALTRAKRDQPLAPTEARADCDGAAVMRGYQLGELFKLDGTPLVISDGGYEIGGYLSPDDMKRSLAALASRKPRG